MAENKTQKLTEFFAEQIGVDPRDLYSTLTQVILGGSQPLSKDELTAFLIVAKKYGLDPFTKEIYAIKARGGGKILPVISLDGWLKLMTRQPTFDGWACRYADTTIQPRGMPVPVPEWCEVSIYDKGRSHPVTIREYFEETWRPTYDRNGAGGLSKDSPWTRMPRRMLRNKTLIQAIRNSYSLGGVLDEDTAAALAEEEASSGASTARRASCGGCTSGTSGTSAGMSGPERAGAAAHAVKTVQAPGYPTLAEKSRLDELLSKVFTRFSPTAPDGAAKAEAWIRSKLQAGETQDYALARLRDASGKRSRTERENGQESGEKNAPDLKPQTVPVKQAAAPQGELPQQEAVHAAADALPNALSMHSEPVRDPFEEAPGFEDFGGGMTEEDDVLASL